MASSKRPRSKKTKRNSKVRQTILNSFTVPQSVLQPEIVGQSAIGRRRSTRGAGSVVDAPNSPPVPSLATLPAGAATLPAPKKAKKPKQQIIRLEKPSVIPTPVSVIGLSSPLIHAPKPPNFAVVIYTRSKKSSEQSLEPAQTTGSWFQPGVRLKPSLDGRNDVFPILEQEIPLEKGQGEKIAPQDTGNTTDEDTDPILTSAKKRRGNPVTEALDDIQDEHSVVVGIGGIGKKPAKKPRSLGRTETQAEDVNSNVSTIKQVRSKGDQRPRTKYGHGGNGSVDDPAIPAARRRSKEKGKQVKPEEIDSINDDPATPMTKKNTKGKGKRVALKETEITSKVLEHEEADGDKNSDEDRQDDLTILSQKRNVLASRTRYNGSSPKKTPFQRKLAELRAKKAGKQIQEEDSDDDKPRRALYDTDEEGEDESGNRDNGAQTDSDSQSDSVSWIIEDGEGTLNVGIPIEFTHLSHQTEQQNFKTFCLWVVQTILNPDFPKDNEISQYAIRALERKMDSYGGSVLQSSIWKAPFMRAMRARPSLETESCEERPNCDACGIGKRPATHAVRFAGNRYDRETLEDLEDSDADDSEDSAGLNIPDETKVFYLGRNCHQRARMSHAFIHWKKELRDEIHGLLQEKGYFTPFWVNKAAKMDPAERTKWANTVTEDLDDVIKALYTDLKKGLQDAQSNMTNQRSGRWR